MSVSKTRPKKIEQYQVLDLLGKGGNGVVYKGIDMAKGTFVAIKQIVIDKAEIKNIKFEINVLKELNDPFIVKYIDAIQVSNKIYLILEYLEGGSLGSLVQKTPLQQKLVKKYIKQVLKGLEYLHKHHVAHRDLKGTNILLTKQGKAKITDFGVAIQVNDTQKTLSSAGTPYWMAPEAIINQSATNVQCDIWSLGCTVIQLLTGNPPYHDLMPYPALFRIVEDLHPPLPQNITPACTDFLMKCFVKDTKKRARAQQLLKHKWIKEGNQHKSSSFSVDIENIVFENDTKISNLIKSSSWQQLYDLAVNTTNKKTIYYNKSFIQITVSPNTDHKLKFIKELIMHNHEALKYLSTIGVLRKMLESEVREGWRITKLKLIQFLCECYELCEENNDLLVWLSDFLPVFKHLFLYMAINDKELPKRIVHVAKLIDLLYKLVHSSLLIDEHLMFMLEESSEDQFQYDLSLNVFENMLSVVQFVLGLKNSEMSFQVVSIFKKHILYTKNNEQSLNIYLDNNRVKGLTGLSECFYDFRVLFEFISLMKTLVSFHQFQRNFQKDPVLICQVTRTLNKLMNLQTITMEEHEILLQLVQFLSIYLNGPSMASNKELIKQFIQMGGAKTLTSMPESYRKNQKIYQNVSGLIEMLDM